VTSPSRPWVRAEGLGAAAPRRLLVTALAVVDGVLLASWIPHYLTWPWWPDLDAFAVLAQAWEVGLLPYRDMAAFNFPGQIYLMWALGKVFGWGRTAPFYALDAGLVVTLGLALVMWSRRRFSTVLPGLVGSTAFLGYRFWALARESHAISMAVDETLFPALALAVRADDEKKSTSLKSERNSGTVSPLAYGLDRLSVPVFDRRSNPGNRCGARKGKQLFENLVLGRLGGEGPPVKHQPHERAVGVADVPT
jgi:hypothetical protein